MPVRVPLPNYLIGRIGLRFRLFLASVEMIPVEDRIEAQCVGALGLPSPEGTQCKHYDVALTERLIERQCAVGERLTTGKLS